MTAINRTAYPRLDARLNQEELGIRYTLNETDHAFIRANTRGEWGRLTLAMLLKTRQDFGCFPALEEMHLDTVTHLASQLGLLAPVWSGEAPGSKSLYRYQAAVRAYLSLTPYGSAGRAVGNQRHTSSRRGNERSSGPHQPGEQHKVGGRHRLRGCQQHPSNG
jgi:hypothetical protein